ncbi:MAG: hypothetical protein O3B13_25945 [Planctomycetota bacterium]|nr:hypothetical protein [Planctomycetota bacterium]MDA1166553.1 hypothetical protein [Planctomycetota bacterium]
MLRTFAICVFLFGFPLIACTQDDDAVLSQFNHEMMRADASRQDSLSAVVKWFDSQEKDARRRGMKGEIDALGTLWKLYEKHGIIPPDAPPALSRQQKAYREKTLTAYENAISGYTRNGNDKLAAQMQAQRDKFRATIKQLPYGIWELRYFPGNVRATTTISGDLTTYHVDTVGRKEHGRVELEPDKIVIHYSKFVEVWASPDGKELHVAHYFPASDYPAGHPSHQAVGTRKRGQ